MVGRERERAQLRRALETACAGVGRLVLVSGEAGIGKTTLVEDLAVQAEALGALVLSGGCYDLTTTPPYGPWLDAFREYRPRADLPERPPLLRGGEGGAGSQAERFEQVCLFLDTLARQVPVLLILEDVHWSDSASLDLLRLVARRIRQSRLLLIATWRVDELSRQHWLFRLLPVLVRESDGLRVDLSPLADAAQRALVEARYQLPPAERDALLAYLRQHAEGNPFFLTELLRSLEEAGVLSQVAPNAWRLRDMAEAPVPDLIRQVIDARVARLGENARTLLEVAAVLGYDVPLDLWAGLSACDDATLQAVARRVVDARLMLEHPPFGYRFSHALVREAIYHDIVLPRRQALHRQTAERLAAAASPDPDVVAFHFRQANDGRAASWLMRAGEQASRQFAPEAAIDRFTSALAVSGDLTEVERIETYLARGRARETLGAFSAAVADAETARQLAGAAGVERLEWQALIDLGVAWGPTNYSQAGRYFRQALELARSGNDRAAVAASLTQLGLGKFNLLKLDEALGLLREALGILEELGDLPSLARLHDSLAVAWWGNGDAFRAAEHWTVAIRLFERSGDRRQLASALCGSLAVSMTDFHIVASGSAELAASRVERGLRISREIDWRPGEIFALVNRARLAFLRGEVDTGLIDLRRARDLTSTIEHYEWSAAAWWVKGSVMLRVAAFDVARSAFEQALRDAEKIGSRFWIKLIAPSLAVAWMSLDEFDRARSVLEAQFGRFDAEQPLSGTLHDAHHVWALASLKLESGDAAGALALLDRLLAALPHADQGIVPGLAVLRGEALERLGRRAEAGEAFAAARTCLAGFGERPLRIIACAGLARVAEPDDAQTALDEARELASIVSAHLTEAPLRTGFETAIDALLARASIPALSSANVLSAREVEVLRFVAEGLTDVEVAERLFLSRRTVSAHLRSIYNKLGVSTRTAAARQALEQHLI
jgi:DNA-binding CsgD family transcriptional regulator/tetratricopeptide (TPR) repeat protein